ncbi:MAG: SdiA-regulated domain-containing protein [Thermaurantimonas sp.]
MIQRIIILLLVYVLAGCMATRQTPKPETIKPYMSHYIDVPEPSDLVYYAKYNSLFIVSDDGDLYETTLDGKIIRKSPIEGVDFEAITIVNDTLYVVEERHRNVLVIEPKDLKLIKTIQIPYAGGRNKSFESITYIPEKKSFLLITEKDPVYIMEFDRNFRSINIIRFQHARDISSATYYDGHLYLLSDEDRTIFKLSTLDYSILSAWKIPVINPEGILFMPDRTLRIISDDREKMYYFKNPNP